MRRHKQSVPPLPLYHCSAVRSVVERTCRCIFNLLTNVNYMIWSLECEYIYSKCIQTLHCRWHEGYREINCTARAHRVFDRLLNAKDTRGEEAQAVAAYIRDFRLTWRRNTQLQMIWLWKWLESQSNCIFSRWKDKGLFNLLFWIPNFFSNIPRLC